MRVRSCIATEINGHKNKLSKLRSSITVSFKLQSVFLPCLPIILLLLLAAPTWLWGPCGRHTSPPASSVMDIAFRRSDGLHVSVDTVHPSLLRSSIPYSIAGWTIILCIFPIMCAVASRRTRGPIDNISFGAPVWPVANHRVVFRILRVFRIVWMIWRVVLFHLRR